MTTTTDVPSTIFDDELPPLNLDAPSLANLQPEPEPEPTPESTIRHHSKPLKPRRSCIKILLLLLFSIILLVFVLYVLKRWLETKINYLQAIPLYIIIPQLSAPRSPSTFEQLHQKSSLTANHQLTILQSPIFIDTHLWKTSAPNIELRGHFELIQGLKRVESEFPLALDEQGEWVVVKNLRNLVASTTKSIEDANKQLLVLEFWEGRWGFIRNVWDCCRHRIRSFNPPEFMRPTWNVDYLARMKKFELPTAPPAFLLDPNSRSNALCPSLQAQLDALNKVFDCILHSRSTELARYDLLADIDDLADQFFFGNIYGLGLTGRNVSLYEISLTLPDYPMEYQRFINRLHLPGVPEMLTEFRELSASQEGLFYQSIETLDNYVERLVFVRRYILIQLRREECLFSDPIHDIHASNALNPVDSVNRSDNGRNGEGNRNGELEQKVLDISTERARDVLAVLEGLVLGYLGGELVREDE